MSKANIGTTLAAFEEFAQVLSKVTIQYVFTYPFLCVLCVLRVLRG